MPEEDKVRGLSPYDLRRILGDEALGGTKLLGKKSDDTFENVKTDDEGRLLVYDPKVGSLISYSGITTADGAPGGLTLVDDVLITKPDFNGNLVIITSGDYEGQARDINGITTAGTVTPLSAFDGQILEETTFVIVALRFTPAEVAALAAKVDTMQGLVYYGVVTDVPIAGQFTIATLAGLGAGKFSQVGGVTQYYAYVFREHTGGSAAPQGESQVITNYATNTGNFTANAFTVDVDIGDEILIIHPFLARIMNFEGLPPHSGLITANWSTGVGTSGEAGEDLLGGASAAPAIGLANTLFKLHSLLLDVSALTDGAIIHVKLFLPIVGAEQKVYDQQFTVPTTAAGETPPPDTNGLWIVNGTLVIHDLLRVEVHSNTNEIVGIGYTYILEAM